MENYELRRPTPYLLLAYFHFTVVLNLFKPDLFCKPYPYYPFVTLEHLAEEFSVQLNQPNKSYPMCPVIVNYANKVWKQIHHPPDFWQTSDITLDEKALTQRFELSNAGGMWKPPNCTAIHKIALVVPYRNRSIHLKKFVLHIHPFLQLQMVEYRIVVVEQLGKKPFNKGALLNIGFLEIQKLGSEFNCYIFNDVDLLPLHLQNVYGCARNPRHLSGSVNSFRYLLPHDELFGGVIAVTRDQFVAVNGFSNQFTGWGGEDDEFYRRLVAKGYTRIRLPPLISTYRMLPHLKATANDTRLELLEKSKQNYGVEGLSTVNYAVVSLVEGPLYTLIRVVLR